MTAIWMTMTKPYDTVLFQKKKERFLLMIDPEKPLDLAGIFQNSNPVYIEIGSGKGEFISEYALKHPQWNFIGFELKQKRVDIILRKLDLTMHGNVRVATFMIDSGIEKMIPANSITGVFIQHPDPWPKRKHFKRRLVQAALLDALSGIIKPGGFIQVSTDHADYAHWIWKEFDKRKDYNSLSADGISASPLLDEHIITFYEREQRRLGFEPQHMLFKRL
jgi:tRNA (guanine-N7-)-methyltransferase